MIRDQTKADDIVNALSYIDPDISYSEWLSIGMALHSWDDYEGLILWDEWSRKGCKYESGYTEGKWNSFNGDGITIKTLFAMAMENGYDPKEKHDDYENEEMSIQQHDPTELPCIALSKRRISAEVCKIYDVHTSVLESDGKTIDKSFFPYKKNGLITGWHVRNHNPKDKRDKIHADIGVGSGKLDFFGQDVAKRSRRKKLFITEGRIDCLSLAEVFVKHTPTDFKGFNGVVSINNGSGSALKDCLNNRDFIESFQEVVLVFDADEEGEKSAKKVLKSFPKFKVAKLPNGLDCNDMLSSGRDKELYNIVMWKSEHIRQGKIVRIKDIKERAMVRPVMGIETPWPTVTKLCYGFRPHTIHIIGAAPKIGKSDHEYQVIDYLANKLDIKTGVFDFENIPEKTAKKIGSKKVGTDFTNPSNNYSDSLLDKTLDEMNDNIYLYDRDGSREWPDVRIAIEEMHLLDGINIFTVDSLTSMISRYSASEANDRLNDICTDMADLVYKYPITILNYCHVNPKPKGSKPHEEGARVLSSEFTGSRAMEKWFHYGWGIRRNRSPDCPPEEQNISYLDLLFDRDFGNSGTATLYFDRDNMSYLEV